MEAFNDCKVESFETRNFVREPGMIIQVPANIQKGFSFDYMLFVPNSIDYNTSLIVEGANVSCSIDDIEKAKRAIIENVKELGNLIYHWNAETRFPVLTPVFPRIYDGKGTIYTHMLSSNALRTEKFGLKRIDIQLVNMINDAKERLLKNYIVVDDKIIIDGFSASSKFANRFTILHPEIVKLCIGGGVGGCLTLPLREINGEKLLYPIGIGDMQEITDDKVQLFLGVKQFYYQGMQDTNDAFASEGEGNSVPKYKEVITEEELSQLYRLLGRDMNNERWEKTQKYYNKIGVNAEFASYINANHTPHCASERVKELLNGEKLNTKRK